MDTKGGHSCVVCPYHGWAFDGTGSLQDVPVSTTCQLHPVLLLAAIVAAVDSHVVLVPIMQQGSTAPQLTLDPCLAR